MIAAHGLAFERSAAVFVGRDPPPPFYSNLTILRPGSSPEVLKELQWLAERFGGSIGVKDSFCEHDLGDAGFRTLFKADWLWRAPGAHLPPTGWSLVESAEDL